MATDKQIAANRANAAKSTGPCSVEGKAVSSMNAVTSGIYAESEIIKGENPDALDKLADSFYLDYQPANAMEAALLDNVIRDTWLLIRFARIDVEILDYKIQEALFKKPHIQAFKELERLQAERRAQSGTGLPACADVTAVSSTPPDQIGFVPSTLPP